MCPVMICIRIDKYLIQNNRMLLFVNSSVKKLNKKSYLGILLICDSPRGSYRGHDRSEITFWYLLRQITLISSKYKSARTLAGLFAIRS